MKRLITILTLALLVCALCITSSATAGQYIYEFDNVTIVFDEDTVLDQRGRMAVVECLLNEKADITTYGLWCTLFGHTYETHSATKITHCVYETDPRCLEEIYDVQVCSRCENTISEVVGKAYISCCPEE